MARRIDELRKLSKEELRDMKSSLVARFRKVKILLKSGQTAPENINESRALKVDIARVSTVLKELELLEKLDGKSK
ncbi:MAG: hypothetical protein KatS3mg084_0439 [Candidatus Dojkabacteria bacterium]|jgi:ribosomal protein L29|nr:MAG: hypothetical protein KatS3mg084_0439 [Candidatus Dojkabacteria bacterium]